MTVTDEDISRDEARFIIAQSFDKTFKDMHGETPSLNRLKTEATIRDLPGILHNPNNRVIAAHNIWGLNYLDKYLLTNVVWE